MVRRFFLGITIPTIALVSACTGAPTAEDNARSTIDPAAETTPVPEGVREISADTAQDSQPQDPQGRGSLAQDRFRAEVLALVKEAEQALDLQLWNEAGAKAARALEYEPSNEAARRVLTRISAVLGDGFEFQVQDPLLGKTIAWEQDRARAARQLEFGQIAQEAGRLNEAIKNFNRARLILRSNAYGTPNSELERRAEQMLANAREQLARERADREQSANEQTLDDLERQRQVARRRRQERLRTLLQDADANFRNGDYDTTISRLDDALALDPDNGKAISLRDMALKARSTQRRNRNQDKWRQEWVRTFQELTQDLLPQVQTLSFDDLDRWAEVSARGPLEFTSNQSATTPEELAILEILDRTVVEHRFPSATLDDWMAYYRRATGLNFIKDASLEDLDESSTTLEDFNLPARSVRSALDVISSQTGVKYRVRNGAVQLLSSDAPVGRVYQAQYEVTDIVQGVRNKPGPDLKLKTSDEPEPFFEPEEPEATVVNDSFLIDLIQGAISPDSWGDTGSIASGRGSLIVRNTQDVHEKIEALLNDLRAAVGIQIDVESRFLRVADNFLEEVGIDFRGLGDQAAGGVPGPGLVGQPSFQLDDFGPPATLNVVNPGPVGTGTEPGLLFNDGGDGAYITRTEHLFDEALGGSSNLDNLGGLSLQYAFLDDIELEAVLRAVAKSERSEQITAPRLLVYNNTRANVNAVRETSYIKDFDVEIAQSAAIANPVIDVIRDGVVLDVRPVVSADRRFITMELRPTILTLQLPIPTFTTTLGTGQPVSIQLPRVTLQRVRTTVTMPDGGTLMLGGMKMANRTYQRSGVPILKDIPGLSFFFSRTGTFVQNERIVVLVTSTIILNEEYFPVVPTDGFDESLLGAAGR